eukprot:10774641-Karenia_brevis.AAC.1
MRVRRIRGMSMCLSPPCPSRRWQSPAAPRSPPDGRSSCGAARRPRQTRARHGHLGGASPDSHA